MTGLAGRLGRASGFTLDGRTWRCPDSAPAASAGGERSPGHDLEERTRITR